MEDGLLLFARRPRNRTPCRAAQCGPRERATLARRHAAARPAALRRAHPVSSSTPGRALCRRGQRCFSGWCCSSRRTARCASCRARRHLDRPEYSGRAPRRLYRCKEATLSTWELNLNGELLLLGSLELDHPCVLLTVDQPRRQLYLLHPDGLWRMPRAYPPSSTELLTRRSSCTPRTTASSCTWTQTSTPQYDRRRRSERAVAHRHPGSAGAFLLTRARCISSTPWSTSYATTAPEQL